MEFRRGQFQINNKSSEEFNVFMRERPERQSSGRVIELRERPGNSSLVIDYDYYKNVEWKISCYAKVDSLYDVSYQEELISNWLDMGQYSDFHYFYDINHIYKAVVISPPVFTGKRANGNLIPFEFTLSLAPFKETFLGREWIEFKDEITLINEKPYYAKPKIHIVGKGNITIFINEQKYILKDIENEITIDSLIEEAYKLDNNELVNMNNFTYFKDYPILQKGRNNIRIHGLVSKVKILPRWRTKV